MKDIYAAMQDCLGLTAESFAIKLAKKRLIPIHGKLDREKADGVCKTMLALEAKEIAPITLLISSGGGDVDSGNYIGGMIDTLHSPIDGLVIDYAGSMAVDILQNCRGRWALPNAQIFVHFTRCGFETIIDSDEISVADIEAIKRRMTSSKRRREDLYMKRLKKTKEEIHDLFRMGEKYHSHYTADEALKLGLIDNVDYTFKWFHDKEAVVPPNRD